MFILLQHNCKKSNVPKHSTKNSNIYVNGQMPYVFLLTGCQNDNTICNVKIGPYYSSDNFVKFLHCFVTEKRHGRDHL